MIKHIGKGYGLDKPGSKRNNLTALTGALSPLKAWDATAWITCSSSFLSRDTEVVSFLGDMAKSFDYLVVTNDHNDVPDELFHMSVDCYELDGILRWYFNTEEEAPAY